MTGTTQYLKSRNPAIRTICVEPDESPVLSGGNPGSHTIPGIGPGFIPENCRTELIDEIQRVKSEDALAIARALASKEGILVGVSAGAAVSAAIVIGKRPENKDKTIVVIIPSFGERYLSHVLFADLTKEAVDQAAEPIDAEWKMN
jgi:cysteine synthase A